MPDGDLVFRARIDLLFRNLGVVEGVLTLIEERFHRGPTLPAGVDDDLKQVSDLLWAAEGSCGTCGSWTSPSSPSS